uniref:Uncharacterized protein n=1 Tax=Romanomermis culicivorax TaxID=13658 RepID=A0A915J0T1_ROMCU
MEQKTKQRKVENIFCSKPPLLDNKPCQPSDQRWYPHPFDRRKYYFCEISLSKYLIGLCQSFNGMPKIFDSARQMCVDDRLYQPTMNAQIRARQKTYNDIRLKHVELY